MSGRTPKKGTKGKLEARRSTKGPPTAATGAGRRAGQGRGAGSQAASAAASGLLPDPPARGALLPGNPAERFDRSARPPPAGRRRRHAATGWSASSAGAYEPSYYGVQGTTWKTRRSWTARPGARRAPDAFPIYYDSRREARVVAPRREHLLGLQQAAAVLTKKQMITIARLPPPDRAAEENREEGEQAPMSEARTRRGHRRRVGGPVTAACFAELGHEVYRPRHPPGEGRVALPRRGDDPRAGPARAAQANAERLTSPPT